MGKIKEACIIIREMGEITLKFKELNGRMNNDNHKELLNGVNSIRKCLKKNNNLQSWGFN